MRKYAGQSFVRNILIMIYIYIYKYLASFARDAFRKARRSSFKVTPPPNLTTIGIFNELRFPDTEFYEHPSNGSSH